MRGVLRVTAVAAALAAMLAAQDDLRTLYAEAQQAQASGDLASATQKYEAIIRLEPRMAEAYANLGNLYYQQGQGARAKTAYQKALELKPGLAGPHFFLGVIGFGEHNYETALKHLQRAVAEQPTNSLIYAYLGYTDFARGSYREAANSLEKAAELNPADIDVLYHLSKSYAHLADQDFAQLQAQFGDSVYPILVRAHLDEAKEDWTDARDQYRLALKKIPDNTRLREKEKWSAAKAAGQTPEMTKGPADQVIDGSLEYKDRAPSGMALRQDIEQLQSETKSRAPANRPGKADGRDLYLEGEAYQSLAYLTSLEVLESDPDSYRAHQLRAQMLEQSNNDDGAIAEYREALKRKPDLQNIHFAIGSIYWKNHQSENAKTELELELKADPHHPQALYELGDLCASTGRPGDAEKYFLEALKLAPDMVEPRFALEKIYTESGRYDKSIEQLRAVLKDDPGQSTAHYRLAQVYRKMGRPEDAQREIALFDRSRTQPGNAQKGSSTVK
jgi:tetratricopeptide (TPR) repeat protein